MNELRTPNDVTVSFTGTALPLFGRTLLAVILVFLVVPAPWAMTALYRWIVEHLSLSDGTRTAFTGKGGDIWPVFMLVSLSAYAGFCPVRLLPIFLLPITLLLYIIIMRWLVRNVSLSCGTPLAFTGSYWAYLGWTLLVYVSFVTIVGWAWVSAAMVRWFCRNVRGGEHSVEFIGTGLEILWRTVVTCLACCVIIPIPWVTLWLFRWYLSNVRIRKA
jgi:hypothetical protein